MLRVEFSLLGRKENQLMYRLFSELSSYFYLQMNNLHRFALSIKLFTPSACQLLIAF